MKNKYLRIIGLMALTLSFSIAQATETTMFIHGTTAHSETLANIQRLTFANGNLLPKTANDEITFALVGISKITFSETPTTSIKTPATIADIAVYPNPATDILYIDAPESSTISIVDLYGRIVGTKYSSPVFFNQSIDVSALPTGLYLLQINTPNGTITKKFIKK